MGLGLGSCSLMDSQFFLSFPIWHVVTRRVALSFDGVAVDHTNDFSAEVCSDKRMDENKSNG